MIRNLIILLSLLPLGSQAQVSIVTSIEPLFQLTSTIMQGAGKPELLIKRIALTHDFAFKPSHFRLLQNADLVIWIDRYFESGFQQLPQILRKEVIQLELLRALNLEQQDGHIWYSPGLLKPVTQKIRDALIEIDPQNRETYRRNARELTDAIASWHKKSKAEIKAAKPRYILDHDFLSHFEKDMEIKSIAVLHDTNEQPVGIKALQAIENNLGQQADVCLLTNEATASKLAQNLARKYNLRIYTIGQTNASLENTPAIIQTLDQFRQVLTKC